jgi:hypothetical protein
VAKAPAEVEKDPDPWIRKSRSTSKKHRKNKRQLRPLTAPERNAHRQSSSSLSAIVSEWNIVYLAKSPFNPAVAPAD